MGDIYLYDVKYYVTLRPFQRSFYKLEVIKIITTKKFKSFTTNNQQNINTFRHDLKLVDLSCPEYAMCPVYGEVTLLALYCIHYDVIRQRWLFQR